MGMIKAIFGQLFIDRGSATGSALHLFLSQPTPLEQKNLGRIFALIEFTEQFSFAEEVVNYLDDHFFQSYYRSSDFEVEAAFERSLHKVNTAVHDLINQHGEDWVYKTNIVLGVVYDSDIHLSYVGKIEAYLAQNDAMVDIIQHPQTAEIQPLKLFNNIISGKCPEKGALIIATSTMLDYLSLEKIRRSIKDQSPAEAVQNFETLFSEQDTMSNVAAFIIKYERTNATTDDSDVPATTSTTPMERSQFSDDRDSMEKLIHQERTTGDLLTPSIWPSLKQRIKNVSNLNKEDGVMASKTSSSQNYAKSQSPIVTWLIQAGKFIAYWTKQILIMLVRLGRMLFAWLKRFFKNPDSLSATVGGSMRGTASWWRRLSNPRKIFLALFILTLIIFGVSLLRKDNEVDTDATNQTQAATLTEVRNKLGEVESKQIMKDEAGARELLSEAETLLAEVPADSKAYTETNGDELRAKINEYNGALNKVKTLASVETVASFSSIENAATVGNITKIGNNVYGFAESNDSVYRVNLSDKAVTTVIAGSDSESAVRGVENDSAATTLAQIGNKKFVQFNPVLEKTSPVTVTLKDKVAVTDFDVFANRLYVLDVGQKNILRLNKSANNYNQSETWLDETVGLENAVTFDIDGSIYVLFKDGSIKKYDGGTESEFTVATFSPSLSGATELLKTDPAEPFYILNPTTQRVVVLNGDGNLEQQFTHPEFANAKDLLVDGDTAYVLTSNNVVSFSLKTE